MQFKKSLNLNVPAEYAFRWHTQPGALPRLLPPWENVIVHHSSGGIQNGDRVEMSVPMTSFFRKRWVAEHIGYEEGKEFTDVQLKGPFHSWKHHHLFESTGTETSVLHDEINYELPFGPVGKMGAGFVSKKLDAMFAYRHARTQSEIETHYQYRDRPRMRILVTGSTGLIGTSLISFLTTGGHDVVRLVRSEKMADGNPHAIFWNIKEGEIDRLALEKFDAVIHLAGAGIAEHRWTPKFKEIIKDSRVKSTQFLSAILTTLTHKPKVLISASAIGYYGDRGDEELTEDSETGVGFLPEVGREWEQAADAARNAGIRVVHPRIGVVLTPAGAALKKLRTPFELGLGGVVGSGNQFWSSISLHDVTGALHHCLMNEELEGPVNVVMPEAVTNREFVKTLGKLLKRPTIFPLPSFAVNLLMGEMGKALLLESTRVIPQRLLDSGYIFQTPTLEATLRQMLGKLE